MRLLVSMLMTGLVSAAAHAQQADAPAATVTPEGLIVTSHVLPLTADGTMAAGDVAAQTRQALANLDALLRTHGGSLARAASIHVFLKDASDFAAMNEAYAPHFAADPPARTTIVAGLGHPGALVQVSAVGLTAEAPREVVHPKHWPRSPNPYSYAVRSGDTLWLAGLVARRGHDLSMVEGDIAAQTGVIVDNAEAILAAAGMTLADLVSSRVFITEAAAFQMMNAAYRARLPEPRPVRATVVCGLMHPAFRIEITFVAVKGGGQPFTTPRPDGSPGTPGPNFSSAIRAGNRVFLSGFLGISDATRGDVEAQARDALATVDRTLTAAGASWADVTDAIVYVTEPPLRGPVERLVREAAGREGLPITSVVTGLVADGGLVEIMVTARTSK